MTKQEKLIADEAASGKVTMFEVHLATGGIGMGSIGEVPHDDYLAALVAAAGILVREAAEQAGGPDHLTPGALRDWARILRGETPHRRRS